MIDGCGGVEFDYEAPFVAEMLEARQHFFYFLRFFIYSEFGFLRSPASSSRKREKRIHRLAQPKNDD